MKIGEGYNQQVNASAKKAQEQQGTAPVEPKKAEKRDESEISSAATLLDKALEAPSQERSARVARLTELYKSGKYEPDAEKISRALVENMLEENEKV